MFNKKGFRASLILADYTIEKLAEELGLNPATLYRKMNDTSDFTRKEILEIRDCLSLTNEKMDEIFFTK